MSCDISSNRARQCKDSQGGLKEVYIFSFTNYSRSQIVVDGLTLTDFPLEDLLPIRIYRYYVIEDAVFDETQNEDKSYTQSISLRFPRIPAGSNRKMEVTLLPMIRNDVRMILRDRNGVYRMLGAHNGLFCNNLRQVTGGSKSDFNGFELDFEGLEEQPAYFLDDLSLFEVEELLLMEDSLELLYEDELYIALE